VLEECATVGEAETLLRSMRRTTYACLTLCDRDGGAVFEITPKNLVVRKAEKGVCACTNHFCTKGLALPCACRRLPVLEKCRELKALGLAEVAKKLHAVNQGAWTLQTMIFEPARLRLHLAFGKGPATALPLKALELGPLFKPAKANPTAAAANRQQGR
jgi:isopenicillin-N N-acyltransferase-like protein